MNEKAKGVCHRGTRKHHTELLNWQLKFAVNVAHNKKGIGMLGVEGKIFTLKKPKIGQEKHPMQLAFTP